MAITTARPSDVSGVVSSALIGARNRAMEDASRYRREAREADEREAARAKAAA